MSPGAKHIKPSVSDQRTSLGRRIINLGPKYPGREQRTVTCRRQNFKRWVNMDRVNFFGVSKAVSMNLADKPNHTGG